MDDSKDDQIPLGYAVRKRKNKEQKAKFLRQERERKAMNQRELTIQEKEHARKEKWRNYGAKERWKESVWKIRRSSKRIWKRFSLQEHGVKPLVPFKRRRHPRFSSTLQKLTGLAPVMEGALLEETAHLAVQS